MVARILRALQRPAPAAEEAGPFLQRRQREWNSAAARSTCAIPSPPLALSEAEGRRTRNPSAALTPRHSERSEESLRRFFRAFFLSALRRVPPLRARSPAPSEISNLKSEIAVSSHRPRAPSSYRRHLAGSLASTRTTTARAPPSKSRQGRVVVVPALPGRLGVAHPSCPERSRRGSGGEKSRCSPPAPAGTAHTVFPHFFIAKSPPPIYSHEIIENGVWDHSMTTPPARLLSPRVGRVPHPSHLRVDSSVARPARPSYSAAVVLLPLKSPISDLKSLSGCPAQPAALPCTGSHGG